jgi:serine/threonine protein kinase/formylglycine-generating enzyme required for sulfatase activity
MVIPAIDDIVSPQSISANEGRSTERYQKIRQLGAGAFGTVWLAEDTELGRPVAIKEPREDRISNGQNIETYRDEARILASLDHPNIVPVYDVGHSASGSCYFVSKWIDGLDLSAYVAQQPLSFERIASLIAQVADALQQTHQRGLVHRDIKPTNILVDRNGHPYLADFGLALREENFEQQIRIIGTPAYMSPEQARGEGHLVDGRSDIFSLGIVLYELLTGARPFRGMDWKQVLRQINSANPTPPRQRNESIPRELERICLKALAKRPADRYVCAADLAEDLRSWSMSPVDLKQRVGTIRLPSSAFFQLAHDYMVPSLREWLTRKQRETKKGRAELKLAERAAAWGVNQESKQLPTLLEWFQIRRLTEPDKWKANEEAVMQQATRYHMQRIALATAAVVLLAFGGWFAWRETSRQKEATRIAGLVDTLVNAEPARIPEIVKQLNANPGVARVAEEYLAPKLTADGKMQRARLHARLASVERDLSLVEPLVEELLTGKVNYVLPIRQLLKPSAAKLSESLKSVLIDEKADPQRRFRAALALADYLPTSDEATWSESHRRFVAQQLVSSNAEFQPILREALRPIQDKLLSDLERIFGDSAASESQRLSVANAMADYAANDRPRLTQLLTVATPEQYEVLFPLVSAVPSPETISQLSEIAATLPPEDLGSVPRIAYGQRRANAAVTMLKLGEKEKVLPVFDWTDDPEAMTQFIFRCQPRGITIGTLLDLLEITTRSVSKASSLTEGSDTATSAPTSSTSLAHASGWDHARYALLLAIGEYAPTEIPPARREALIQQLADWYANDPSSGVHGASGWLLRYLGEKEITDRVDQTPVPYSPEREWFTLAITVKPTPTPTPKTFYYTFIVHPSGEYTIGSVEDEDGRFKNNEVRHTVALTRPFALLDREITFEELTAFSPQLARYMQLVDSAPNDAGFGADWYDSVAFCRWLGQEMGLAETDQCYADPETLDKEQYPRDPQVKSFPRDWPLDLSKRGFRLPTESEWEVMARSGSRTAYGYGSEVSMLRRFGWFWENSGSRSHAGRKLRPSVRGLFDLHGNVFEWTHDRGGDFGESRQTDPTGSKLSEPGKVRVFRGGGWAWNAAFCRSANRHFDLPTYRYANLGFRLALVPSGPAGSGPAEPGQETRP